MSAGADLPANTGGFAGGIVSWPPAPEPRMKPVVLTMGTFDLFHAGHVFLLQQCKRLAGPTGRVVVALNSDEFAGRFKPEPPTHRLHERMLIVHACRYADDVIENTGNENAKQVIEEIHPDFLVIGQDWALKDYYAQLQIDQPWLDDRNICLLYVPRPAGTVSSTEIRHRVKGSK